VTTAAIPAEPHPNALNSSYVNHPKVQFLKQVGGPGIRNHTADVHMAGRLGWGINLHPKVT